MTDPVQRQLEAYNNRNLDAFMESYASDVRVESGTGDELMKGSDEVRAFYDDLFRNSPDLHCDVVNRTSVGNWTIDEEEVRGINAEGMPEQAHAVVAYEVKDGKIGFVRMFM